MASVTIERAGFLRVMSRYVKDVCSAAAEKYDLQSVQKKKTDPWIAKCHRECDLRRLRAIE